LHCDFSFGACAPLSFYRAWISEEYCAGGSEGEPEGYDCNSDATELQFRSGILILPDDCLFLSMADFSGTTEAGSAVG
jgi:hypothetical protein